MYIQPPLVRLSSHFLKLSQAYILTKYQLTTANMPSIKIAKSTKGVGGGGTVQHVFIENTFKRTRRWLLDLVQGPWV